MISPFIEKMEHYNFSIRKIENVVICNHWALGLSRIILFSGENCTLYRSAHRDGLGLHFSFINLLFSHEPVSCLKNGRDLATQLPQALHPLNYGALFLLRMLLICFVAYLLGFGFFFLKKKKSPFILSRYICKYYL